MIEELEYKQRRDKLASKLPKNSIGIMFSAESKTRSNDTEYPFRQNSNFYYMSGFLEDKSCLVFVKSKKEVRTILFVHKKDKTQELWNGKRLGVEKAKERFLVDEAFEHTELSEKLKEYLKDKKSLHYDFSLDSINAQNIKKDAKNIQTYENLATLVQEMRLLKSPSEIALIQQAIAITKVAHHKAMNASSKLRYEYELQAEIEYVFKKNGAFSDAYTSIVACGNAANTLHYISNDKKLVEGELILIDAGCEYKYYASDITRSVPVSGKFSEAQRELYEMVLEVELAIIEMIKPNVKRTLLQKKSEELLCQGMIRLGILKGNYKKLLKDKAHTKILSSWNRALDGFGRS